jgi:hypothetical protein
MKAAGPTQRARTDVTAIALGFFLLPEARGNVYSPLLPRQSWRV